MPVWAGAFPISEYADMLKKIFNSMKVATSRALIFSLAGSLVTAPPPHGCHLLGALLVWCAVTPPQGGGLLVS